MSTKKSSLAGKISSLELQLKVLKGLLKKKKGKEKKLSDLYGIVKGNFSYEEIKEAEVKIKEF